jgi:acyl-CoA synthetase (AMP-forming)/AMP-acid ligase II
MHPMVDKPLHVAAILPDAARLHADRVALVGETGQLTYPELEREVARAAHALSDLGVRPGDRVAMSLPNDLAIVSAMLGTFALGAIWVGVHRVLAPAEKREVLDDCGASLFLGDETCAAQVEQLQPQLPELTRVVRCVPGAPDDAWGEALKRADTAWVKRDVDPLAPAAIAYTSGTTGRPKGVVHSQHNVLLPGAVAIARGSFAQDEPIGIMLPMTILNLMVLGPLTTLQLGSKLVAIDRRDPVGVASWIRRERVAVLTTVPTVIHDLITHPDVTSEDLASITKPRIGGANSPEWFRTLFRERFGTELATSYALTEGPTLVTREDPGDERVAGSCGRALPHVAVTIRDAQDRALPLGEVGEICVGPHREGPWAGAYHTMLGYWRQPELTQETLRGGRLHTGDLGRLDAEGRLFLVERRNQLIIRGGSNIYPSEIELVLRADERVADCAVVAREDLRLGEVPIAFVERVPGAELSEQELRERCETGLARYKVPEAFHIVEALPRGAMGKVQRGRLRQQLESG